MHVPYERAVSSILHSTLSLALAFDVLPSFFTPRDPTYDWVGLGWAFRPGDVDPSLCPREREREDGFVSFWGSWGLLIGGRDLFVSAGLIMAMTAMPLSNEGGRSHADEAELCLQQTNHQEQCVMRFEDRWVT